jgi:hypothetical protein
MSKTAEPPGRPDGRINRRPLVHVLILTVAATTVIMSKVSLGRTRIKKSSETRMSGQVFQFVEIVNRLKRGTAERRLHWQRPAEFEPRYTVSLENGHGATIECGSGGSSVLFVMTNGAGSETLHLDSSRVSDDLLRLALLQLFVTVRDSLTSRLAQEALEAVKHL